jgi:YD repeat-containing protein
MLKLSQLQSIVKKKIRETFKNHFCISLRHVDMSVDRDSNWYEVEISYVLPKKIKEIFSPIFKERNLVLDLRRLDSWAEMFMYFRNLADEGTPKERLMKHSQRNIARTEANKENVRILLQELDLVATERKSVPSKDSGYPERFQIEGTDIEIGYGSMHVFPGMGSEKMVKKYDATLGTFAIFNHTVEYNYDSDGRINSINDIKERETTNKTKLNLAELRNLLGLVIPAKKN